MKFEQESQNDQFDTTPEESTTPSQDTASDEISMCLTELTLWKDQCKRISAEFENFKKRTEREQVRWAEIAKESILKELLSFVDTCQSALAVQTSDKVGIEMMYQSLLKLLSKHDVVAMPEVLEFDPQYHEAIMQVESANHTSGQIVQVLSQGFMIKDRVLRPAKVSVAL